MINAAAKELTSKLGGIRSQKMAPARLNGEAGLRGLENRRPVCYFQRIFAARHGTSPRSQLGMAGERLQASIPVEVLGYRTGTPARRRGRRSAASFSEDMRESPVVQCETVHELCMNGAARGNRNWGLIGLLSRGRHDAEATLAA